jgi:hypothetical protein
VLAVTTSEVSNLTIALIALAGAVVGGALTGGAQLLAESMRRKRERQEAEIRARGVGRVVDYFLSMWDALLEQAHLQGRWWSASLEPVASWADADLQLVAGTCEEELWTKIRVALVIARAASAMRRTAGDDPDLEFNRTVMVVGGDWTDYEAMELTIQAGRDALKQEFG